MNYEAYYKNQVGSGLPVFQGHRYQQGMGLGNMFRSFFKWFAPVFKTHALPVLKSGAKTVGTEAIQTVANIATDAIHGKNTAKERSTEALNNLSSKAKAYIQQGSGHKKGKKRKTKIICKSSKKRRTRVKDIFDY
jgi:hypothetical protein